MKGNLWLVALLLSLVCVAPCAAQVPVSLQAPDKDDVGQRFFTSLQSEIRLSNKFYLWGGSPIDLPQEGIGITLITVEVKLQNGQLIGSAVVAIATHPSEKDRGADRLIHIVSWFIPKEQSVADITRNYLASLVGRWFMPKPTKETTAKLRRVTNILNRIHSYLDDQW
jgi:hypothetical protein